MRARRAATSWSKTTFCAWRSPVVSSTSNVTGLCAQRPSGPRMFPTVVRAIQTSDRLDALESHLDRMSDDQ